MGKEKKIQLTLESQLVFIGIFVLLFLVVVGTVYSDIQDNKRDNYCGEVYPSEITEISVLDITWQGDSMVENGYIECCRAYYNEQHLRQSECEVFPFMEGLTNDKI